MERGKWISQPARRRDANSPSTEVQRSQQIKACPGNQRPGPEALSKAVKPETHRQILQNVAISNRFQPAEDPEPNVHVDECECVNEKLRNSQLMQIILIMVKVKKGSGAMSTLTKMAVTRKTTRMTTRLPEILNF